jgi:hypothetical protein
MEETAVARFWAGFHQYDHGRCWGGDATEDEEDSEGLLLEWEVRGPARFEAERERAFGRGGSRLAAKTKPPYGEVGACGRAAYALQLLAALYGLAEGVEAAARARGWEVSVGVLVYREPGEAEEEVVAEEELVTELDPEELAACDTLVFWIEVEPPAEADAAWRLGEGLGRLLSAAAPWFERLDAGDREVLRSAPRLG